ncbi:serine/arginine repetitive matrix protein 1-like isoform X2 [Planococcus citri]|uniref:serine/arginine repetitive matrix protein 1-like isoform X2 n=1 Tax=Planococcus citri TaxID=170843 RepID=UPI0031FA09C1
MKVIIFTLFLSSMFGAITAPCTSSSCGAFVAKYPSQRTVLRTGSMPSRSLQLSSRRYPTSSPVFRSEPPDFPFANEIINAIQMRSKAIQDYVRSKQPTSAGPSVVPSSTNESLYPKRGAGRIQLPNRSGNGTKQKPTPSNSIPNERNVQRVQIPINTNELSDTPLELPVERKQSSKNNPSEPLSEEPSPGNPRVISSVNPSPIQIESEKKLESIIPVPSSSNPPKKEEDEDQWEGPKTLAEEKPELYTTDQNVKMIRKFTSDMSLEGKYKIGEIIYYVLTKKEKELDTADKAAIEYVVTERLQKDPELTAEYKKYNEKHKNENNENQENSDEDMPSYMRQLLSPSFSISQFETPSPTENNTNLSPEPGFGQDFLRSILLLVGPQPPPFFPPGFQNTFNPNNNERNTNPYSGYRRSFVENDRFRPLPLPPSPSPLPPRPQFPPFSPPRLRSAFSYPSRRWNFPSLF